MAYIQTDEWLAPRKFFNGYSLTFTEICFNVVDVKTFVSQAVQPAIRNFSIRPSKIVINDLNYTYKPVMVYLVML